MRRDNKKKKKKKTITRMVLDSLARQQALQEQITQLLPNNAESQVKLAAWVFETDGFTDISMTKGGRFEDINFDGQEAKARNEGDPNFMISGAVKSLIRRIYQEHNGSKGGSALSGNSSTTDGLLSHFADMADRAKKDRKVTVNVRDQIRTASLEDIGMSLYPCFEATSCVATDMAKQKEEGIVDPCPYVPMEKFSPSWARMLESSTETLTGHSGRKEQSQEKLLDTATWAAAAQRWALAMHCCKAMSLCAAHTHIDTCLRMSKECESKGHSHAFGRNVVAIYDRLKRMQIADKAKHGMTRAERERELCMKDTDVLERTVSLAVIAMHAVNEQRNRDNRDRDSKGKGKGKDAGKSHKGSWDQNRSHPYDSKSKGKGKDSKDKSGRTKGQEESSKKD